MRRTDRTGALAAFKAAPPLFVCVVMATGPSLADSNARLEVLRQNAELFGFVTAGADYCDNLTLADIPEVRRAIEVLSSSRAVGQDFRKTNTMARDGIRRDREGSCAKLARNFHWFYEETRR